MMVKMVEEMKLVEVMEAGEVEEKQPPLPQVASMPRPPYSGATPCFAGYWATLNFFQSPYFLDSSLGMSKLPMSLTHVSRAFPKN